jgi:hypothetical protein
MLTNQDFAGRVLSSLEDLRERLAVLEAEVRHVREGVGRVEAGLQAHVADQRHGPGSANGAGVTIRINRKALGGGSLVGGGLVAVAAGVGKALGWW